MNRSAIEPMPFLPNRRARRAWFAFSDSRVMELNRTHHERRERHFHAETHARLREGRRAMVGNQHNGHFIRMVALPSFRTTDQWHLNVGNVTQGEFQARLRELDRWAEGVKFIDESATMTPESVEIVTAFARRHT